MDGRGKVVARRRLSRPKLVAWLANLPPCVSGMEASCGAHHLARRRRALGHDVRLMPAQYVRPFVKTNKHDQADAEGVAEAVQRPQMRFVPIKTEAQLDLQAHPLARRRMTMPGIGALIATALVAAIDAGQAFGRARDLACWLGLVPRQDGTGGKVRLLGISKRGNGYLRRLLVHAARSLKRSAKTRDDRLGAWLRALQARAQPNGATVALAAKLARWAWAVLAHNQPYRPAAA